MTTGVTGSNVYDGTTCTDLTFEGAALPSCGQYSSDSADCTDTFCAEATECTDTGERRTLPKMNVADPSYGRALRPLTEHVELFTDQADILIITKPEAPRGVRRVA